MPRIEIIRASTDFSLVIVAVSTKADVFSDPKTKFYRFEERFAGGTAKRGFKKIGKKTAQGYFSGQADGIGYGKPPDNRFNSFKTCRRWIREAESRFYRKEAKKNNWGSLKEISDEFDEAFADYFGYKPGDGPKPKFEDFSKFTDHYLGLDKHE